jgi:hypothetical protein
MKRYTLLLFMLLVAILSNAQKVTLSLKGVSMSKALIAIDKGNDAYDISFIYDELEDFTVTTDIRDKTVPDAVRQVLGFYPMKMTVKDHQIFVECTQKEKTKLNGRVVDGRNQPVGYANIMLLNPVDSAFVTGGVSNEAGQFVIPCQLPRVIVRVSCIGYKPVCLPYEVGKTGNIRMQEEASHLATVVVKGQRPLVTQQDGALVVDVAGSLLSKSTSMDELLMHVPGVVKTASGGLEVFGSGAPIIYINRHKMRSSAELKQLSPKEIKTVELVTNPGVKYDAEGKSVLIIHTLNKDDGYTVLANAYGVLGFYPRYQGNLSVGYKRGALSVTAYYNGTNNKQRVNQPVERELSSGEDVYRYVQRQNDVRRQYLHDWASGLEYVASEKHTVGMAYDGHTYIQKSYRKSYLDYLLNGVMKQQSDIDNYSNNYTYYHHLNFYHNATWSSRLTSDFNLDYVNNHARSRQNTNEAIRTDTIQTLSRDKSTFNIYAGTLNFDYQAGKTISLSWGVDGSAVRGNGNVLFNTSSMSPSDYKEQEDKLALYGEAKAKLGNVTLKGGVRYEHVKADYTDHLNAVNDVCHTYNDLFPSLSLSHSAKGWTNTLSFSSRTSRPSFTQLSNCSYYSTEFLYQQGNPLLRPAKTYRLQWTSTYSLLTVFIRYEYTKDYIDNGWETPVDRPNVIVSTYSNYPKNENLVAALILQKNVSWWNGTLQLLVSKPFFKCEYLGQTLHYNSARLQLVTNHIFRLPHSWFISPYFSYCNGGDRAAIHFEPYWDLSLDIKKLYLKDRLTVEFFCDNFFHQNKYTETERLGRLYFHQTENYNQWGYWLTLSYSFNHKDSKYHGSRSVQEAVDRL